MSDALTRYWWPGQDAPALGVPVTTTAALLDGTVVSIGSRHIYLGVRPWTALDVAGEAGRRIVRHGLADVLAWLGEAAGPAVDDPYPTSTTRQLLAAMSGQGDLRPGVE